MSKDNVGVGVITRAAAVLRVLGDSPEGLSLGKIAQRVGLARSTVQRLISRLRANGSSLRAASQGESYWAPNYYASRD